MTTDQITERILVPGDEDTVQDMIYQALGAASVCWTDMEGTGAFMSERAKQIGEELMEIFINQAYFAHRESRAEEFDDLIDHLESAWGIIANASDWLLPDEVEGSRWVPFAQQWRDKYHEIIRQYLPPEPVPAPVVKVAEDTLVIETTRKGKYVASYGPFSNEEAGIFAFNKIILEESKGGKHDFVLEPLAADPWGEISQWDAEQAQQPEDSVFDVLQGVVDAFADATSIRSTADLDQRDRFPSRPLTADDVAFPNDPWPGTGKHRKPWSGD